MSSAFVLNPGQSRYPMIPGNAIWSPEHQFGGHAEMTIPKKAMPGFPNPAAKKTNNSGAKKLPVRIAVIAGNYTTISAPVPP